MTTECAILADDAEALVGPRLAAWLRGYDHKTLARMFGAAPQTTKRWKAGELPATKHIAAMLSHWGQGFVDAVLSPVIEDPATLDARAERIEQDMRALRQEIADADVAADRGRVAELASAARPGRGREAVSTGKADQRRAPLAAATRSLGVLICGLALGLGAAQFAGALPTSDDEPTPIMRRAPRGGGGKRVRAQRARVREI